MIEIDPVGIICVILILANFFICLKAITQKNAQIILSGLFVCDLTIIIFLMVVFV